jgi:hypothetical protein
MTGGRYLQAPTYQPLTGPAIFLAGPIRGVKAWQPQAARLIQAEAPELHVCSPRRDVSTYQRFSDLEHAAQVQWERQHLEYCGEHGVILFWLPPADENVPGREYAQTTRVEFGKWLEHARRGEALLAVGIAPGFHGRRYLLDIIAHDSPHTPVADTLKSTCRAAVALARSRL